MNDRSRFDKFTERARKVLSLSQEEAQRLQHNYIGTEHMLTGLICEHEGIAAQALSSFGVEIGLARAALEEVSGRGDRIVLGEIGLTAHAKKAVGMAVEEARRLKHRYIGTEHLLLGLLRMEDCGALKMLQSLQIDPEAVRAKVLEMLPIVSAEYVKDIWSRRPAPDNMDKFNEQARQVLVFAEEEALRFQHNYIGTEHLLLGLVRLEESGAGSVLRQSGVELLKVRSVIEFSIGRGDRIVLGEIGLTPRAKKVIELAADEARRLQHTHIGAEHLLLGLLREGEGIGAGVLESLGLRVQTVQQFTLNALKRSQSVQGSPDADVEQRPPTPERPVSDVEGHELSEASKKVIEQAREEARHWQHDHIGSEHLLLGLLRVSDCPATLVLNSQGVDLSRARSVVETLIGEGRNAPPARITLTPRSRDLLQLAQREAQSLKLTEVTPEILLLTLARSGEGLALSILGSLGVDLKILQIKLLQSF